MTTRDLIAISKTLSHAFRHRPDSLGISLDRQGWCEVDQLLMKMSEAGIPLSRDELDALVATSDKQRFAFSSDGMRIRANQGHSLQSVKLNFKEKLPPPVLYHGTTQSALPSILKQGLKPMSRHHVHLSSSTEGAMQVGRRRGPSAILVVDAFRMSREKWKFFVSENGVWLVDQVPSQYLRVDSTDRGFA